MVVIRVFVGVCLLGFMAQSFRSWAAPLDTFNPKEQRASDNEAFWANKIRQSERGYFVRIDSNNEIFVKVWRGHPTLEPIVLLNGLTQDTDHWQRTLPELLKSGRTIVAMDFMHQGRSLQNFVKGHHLYPRAVLQPIVEPLMGERVLWATRTPLLQPVPVKKQAKTLELVLEALQISSKVVLVGLSYGGGVALQYAADFSHRVHKILLLAPFVEPLAAQDQMIQALITQYRAMFTRYAGSDEELYDYFLRAIVIGSYHMSEPSILKWGPFQPYGAAEMVRGIRHLRPLDLVAKIPPKSLHLVVAGQDAYVPEASLRRFWEGLPNKVKGSLLTIEGVEHKMNESVGPFVAGWIRLVADKVNGFGSRLELKGQPEKGEVVVTGSSGQNGAPGLGERWRLPKAKICEGLLRPRHEAWPNIPRDRIFRYPGEEFFDRFLPPHINRLYKQLAQFFTGL